MAAAPNRLMRNIGIALGLSLAYVTHIDRIASAQTANAFSPVVHLTAEQDHQRTMALLNMTTIRPGRNGSHPDQPNYANYDEAKANPYPVLPNPLVMNNGRKVTSPNMWTQQRRPEIVEMFDREIYGRVPKVTPKVTWEVKSTKDGMNGDVAIVT